MKDLTLEELKALKEKLYLGSYKEQREFIVACEEFGRRADALSTKKILNIGGFNIISSDPEISISIRGATVAYTREHLFVPGDWVEELRGLIAELRAGRKEQQRQELLKQLNPFGLEE